MRARNLQWTLVAAVVFVAAGCADSTAPTSSSADVLPGGAPRPRIIINEMAADESYASFTVTPSGGFFNMGEHGVFIPSDVICDPATTQYGPEFWDDDCDVIREPIQMRAELRDEAGVTWIHFSPNVRFRPSKYPHRWVWIYMHTPLARVSGSNLTILWAPGEGIPDVNEALWDWTLRTFVNPWTEMAYRRIKHFSGYNVTSGRASYREAVAER